MKKKELKQIIREVLTENSPQRSPSQPDRETIEKPDTPSQPKPRRRTLQPPSTTPDIRPKAEGIEKDISNKMASRFNKLKKVNEIKIVSKTQSDIIADKNDIKIIEDIASMCMFEGSPESFEPTSTQLYIEEYPEIIPILKKYKGKKFFNTQIIDDMENADFPPNTFNFYIENIDDEYLELNLIGFDDDTENYVGYFTKDGKYHTGVN